MWRREMASDVLSHISLESGEAENDKGYETTSSCTIVESRDAPGRYPHHQTVELMLTALCFACARR